jgi:HAD superfamily, subfamily IIIB (Acid phosphatase)
VVSPRSVVKGVALFAAGALSTGAIAYAAAAPQVIVVKTDDPATQTVRPTGVGLPAVGQGGTTGIGDLVAEVRTYHDSGDYDRDLASVDGAAKDYVAKRLDEIRAPAAAPTRKCRTRRVRRGKRVVRKRVCTTTTPPAKPAVKPAIVLDIDETSLSNYSALADANFASPAGSLAAAAIAGQSPAVGPTLDLFKWAKSQNVAVFFVTGRPTLVQGATESNLRTAGYSNWDGLSFKPGDQQTVPYKSGERAKIEQKGYTILANVGDQDSDLQGGHAEQSFKLPNPFYFISA